MNTLDKKANLNGYQANQFAAWIRSLFPEWIAVVHKLGQAWFIDVTDSKGIKTTYNTIQGIERFKEQIEERAHELNNVRKLERGTKRESFVREKGIVREVNYSSFSLTPNWTMQGTQEDLERELVGFVFAGPGMYCTDKDTVLVIPVRSTKEIKSKTIWNYGWPKNTVFQAFIWNDVAHNLIFSVIDTVPIREDRRT